MRGSGQQRPRDSVEQRGTDRVKQWRGRAKSSDPRSGTGDRNPRQTAGDDKVERGREGTLGLGAKPKPVARPRSAEPTDRLTRIEGQLAAMMAALRVSGLLPAVGVEAGDAGDGADAAASDQEMAEDNGLDDTDHEHDGMQVEEVTEKSKRPLDDAILYQSNNR
eukprot:3097734-Amphidinium_carterae.2